MAIAVKRSTNLEGRERERESKRGRENERERERKKKIENMHKLVGGKNYNPSFCWSFHI